MKIDIQVPRMGESISEAVVGQIFKKSGSMVVTDDEILELETDKVNQVIYATKSGTVNINVKEGDKVKVSQVIGYIETDKASPKEHAQNEQKQQPEQKKQPPVADHEPETPEILHVENERELIEKPTRVGKEEFIQQITTQTEEIKSAVNEKDIPVEKEKELPETLKNPPNIEMQKTNAQRETRRKMTNIRKVIAERMLHAQHSTAMLTTFNEIDLTQVIELREKYKDTFAKEHGTKLGFMSFFVKATVSALKEFPDLNSYIDNDDIVHREYYDLGIAVGTEKGVFVPVIKDCDRLSFAGIESAIQQYSEKAKNGSLVVDDLQGGGFTITNGGIFGSLLSTPIINPPQSGILGMHKIMKRPVVIEDKVAIRSMMYVALSYDHRIVDGKQAVSFLVHIKKCLEDPSKLLLEL